MEEWISYHIAAGVDQIFLYDNSLSIGRDGSTPTTNKYNINFCYLTAHLSDERTDEMLAEILKKYQPYLTYITWSPQDSDGNIIYGQRESILHYMAEYADSAGWTAFLDMDEFIFSSLSVKMILEKCAVAGIGDVYMLQKKFKDRFDDITLPVAQIVDCIEGIDTSNWAPKRIIRNRHFDMGRDDWNIHYLPVKDCRKTVMNIEELRFNHYNVNSWQLEWMKFYYGATADFTFNARCYALQEWWYHRI